LHCRYYAAVAEGHDAELYHTYVPPLDGHVHERVAVVRERQLRSESDLTDGYAVEEGLHFR
jgi:hypothetical protein